MRTQIRRRRTINETINPAIIVIEDTKTHSCPGSCETWRFTNGVAPSKRTTVPSSSRDS